jgi:3-deoxy-7-phosphoheptulonate synthase
MSAAATTVTTDRPVRIGGVPIGGGRAVLIAGPCAVEPDYVATAEMVAALGVDVLRGSAFKPRTRPDSFQGMGRAGAHR